MRRKVRGFVRSVFPGNAEEEAGFPEGAGLGPLAGLLAHVVDTFAVFVSGFITIALEGRFRPVPLISTERGDGDDPLMMPAVDSVTERIPCPCVANCDRIWNEGAPNLQLALILLLPPTVILSGHEEFGMGRDEVTILSGNGKSLEGPSVMHPDHSIEAQDNVISL